MEFGFTDEQEELRSGLREMLDREAPEEYLRALDEEHRFPVELYEQWVRMGLLALPFPERYGGQGGDVLDFVIVAEEIGR